MSSSFEVSNRQRVNRRRAQPFRSRPPVARTHGGPPSRQAFSICRMRPFRCRLTAWVCRRKGLSETTTRIRKPPAMSVTKETVLDRLKSVDGPDFTGNIVDLGLVSDIFIADSKVFFSITVPAARAQEMEPLRAAAERAVKAIPGVAGAVVALTAEKKDGGMENAPPRQPQRPAGFAASRGAAPASGRAAPEIGRAA